MKKFYFLFVAFALFSICSVPKAQAVFSPSDISGLHVWLDTSQPNSLYTDLAKTTLATTGTDGVAVWADKSGNGNDATMATSTARPPYVPVGDGGYPALSFLGTRYDGKTKYMTLGTLPNLNLGTTSSSTIFLVYNPKGSQSVLLANSLAAGANAKYYFYINATSTALAGGYTTRRLNGYPLDPTAFNSPNIYGYSYELFSESPYSSEYTPYTIETALSEITYTNSTIPSLYYGDSPNQPDPTGEWLIGAATGADLFSKYNGSLQAILIFNRKLSESEMLSVNNYLAGKFNVTLTTPDPTVQVVYDGNSIVYGIGESLATSSISKIIYKSQPASAKYRFTNLGIGGINTTSMNTEAARRVDPLYSNNYASNILVGWEGSNDMGNGLRSGATAYSNLVTYYTDRKNAGWKVIAATVLPRGDSTIEAKRQIINTGLRSNFTQYADVLVDIASDPTIGQPGQNTAPYYGDTVHPTDIGYALISKQFKIAIDAVANPLTTLSNIATSSVTNSGATVAWNTNASSSSVVEFGVNAQSLSTSTAETDTSIRVLNHSLALSGLSACTEYSYRAHSRQLDPAGEVLLKNNDATSSVRTLITTGCTGNASVVTSTTSVIATSTGGTVSLGDATLTVPTSFTATTSSATFQAKELEPTAFFTSTGLPAGKLKAKQYALSLKAFVDATTTLSTFAQPLTVSIAYSPSDVALIDPSSLTIYRYDSGPGWTPLTGCAVNTTSHVVTCNTSGFSDFGLFGDSAGPGDSTAPAISAIASSTTTTTATITWSTDEAASSTVNYGATSAYGTASTSPALVTSHSIVLSGLTPSTLYHFNVGGADAANNVSTSTDRTFTTATAPDVTPPVLSALSVSTTTTTATIGWTTNENANTKVVYGLSASYGNASSTATLSTSHSIILSGLSSATTYHFAYVSADASGNTATSSDQTFVTGVVADITPPVISTIASSPTQTTATITWSTDEAASSTVNYGATSAYGTASTSPALVTSHSIVLSGLTPSTLYHFNVGGADAANNVSTSADQTFTTASTPDVTPPVISSIASSTTSSGATITWTTNEAASSTVNYGATSAYGLASTSPTLLTSHSIILTGLTPLTTYHFGVGSADASNNVATSSDLTFTTSAFVPDTTSPVISSINVPSVSTDSVTITWATDEPADSQIEYGTSVAYGSQTTLDTALVTNHSVTIPDLADDTTYNFQIRSADSSGNIATSSDQTFTTDRTRRRSSGGGGGGGGGTPSTPTGGIPSPGTTTGGAVSTAPFVRMLPLGSSGLDVTSLQTALIARGFSIPAGATGYFGAQTTAALAAFQASVGISPAVGYFGPITQTYFNTNIVNAVVPSVPLITPVPVTTNTPTTTTTSTSVIWTGSYNRDLTIGSVGEDVRMLQAYLNARGYQISLIGPGSPGKETTDFGRATQAALSLFQMQVGITPTAGYFGVKTRAFIESHP